MFSSSLLSVQILSSLTLVGDVVFALLLLALLSGKGKWYQSTFTHIRTYALYYGLLITFFAITGSLFLSNVIGFDPCELCWIQRIFLYPQFILFAIALWKKDETVTTYSLALSSIGIIIALYQSYIQWGGTSSILPCTATGAACSKVFFDEFGYITIPVMSLTAFAYLILLMCIRKKFSSPKA